MLRAGNLDWDDVEPIAIFDDDAEEAATSPKLDALPPLPTDAPPPPPSAEAPTTDSPPHRIRFADYHTKLFDSRTWPTHTPAIRFPLYLNLKPHLNGKAPPPPPPPAELSDGEADMDVGDSDSD